MSATIPTIAARPLSCSTSGEKIFLLPASHGPPLNTSRQVREDSMVNGFAEYPSLEENAGTEEYSGPVVVAAARATKSGVQYARGALRAAGVARKVGQLYKSAKGIQQAGAREAGAKDE